jgi:hypothetical protein
VSEGCDTMRVWACQMLESAVFLDLPLLSSINNHFHLLTYLLETQHPSSLHPPQKQPQQQ